MPHKSHYYSVIYDRQKGLRKLDYVDGPYDNLALARRVAADRNKADDSGWRNRYVAKRIRAEDPMDTVYNPQRNPALLRVRGRNWIQESYETGDPAIRQRTATLKKLGYRAKSESMGQQVTQWGRVKMTMVNISAGTSGDEFLDNVPDNASGYPTGRNSVASSIRRMGRTYRSVRKHKKFMKGQGYSGSDIQYVRGKGRKTTNPETRILRKGWGYWDTTNYPYGGSFRRAAADMPVSVIGPAGKYPQREREVLFADGRRGVVDISAFAPEANPSHRATKKKLRKLVPGTYKMTGYKQAMGQMLAQRHGGRYGKHVAIGNPFDYAVYKSKPYLQHLGTFATKREADDLVRKLPGGLREHQVQKVDRLYSSLRHPRSSNPLPPNTYAAAAYEVKPGDIVTEPDGFMWTVLDSTFHAGKYTFTLAATHPSMTAPSTARPRLTVKRSATLRVYKP